jgi:hypothetical protein
VLGALGLGCKRDRGEKQKKLNEHVTYCISGCTRVNHGEEGGTRGRGLALPSI